MVTPGLNNKRKAFLQIGIWMGILIVLNIVATIFFFRFDLTADKRYTLSAPTKKFLKELDDVVYIKVYLEGEFPAGFQRLHNSTKELLDEFVRYGGHNIQYEFIDPTAGKNDQQKTDLYKQLHTKGLSPVNLKVQDKDNYTEKMIWPGAILNYKNKELPITLLQDQIGVSKEEVLNNSVALLEYQFTRAIQNLQAVRKPNIAILKGHGELPDKYSDDLFNSMSESYNLGTLELNSCVAIPPTMAALMIIKPTTAFSDADKFKIDQYVMHGGKVIWMLDMIAADIDSLRRQNSTIAPDYDLQLTDLLFSYGVRVNPCLIQDLQCAPLPLVTGKLNNEPQTQLFPWYYFPVITSNIQHPIVKNLDALLTLFCSQVDTVGASGIKKTPLLQTSKYSKLVYPPIELNLKLMKLTPSPTYFNKPAQTVAVLLEGQFKSAYKNRLSTATSEMLDSLHIQFKEESVPGKMIVIGDGDIGKNPLGKDMAYPCGYYPFTKQTFSNKTFLLNCVQYLVDSSGLIETRGKEFKLRLLDRPRIQEEGFRWQLFNMIAPVLLILFGGLIYNLIRNKKYS